jgi:hypothetical protein
LNDAEAALNDKFVLLKRDLPYLAIKTPGRS